VGSVKSQTTESIALIRADAPRVISRLELLLPCSFNTINTHLLQHIPGLCSLSFHLWIVLIVRADFIEEGGPVPFTWLYRLESFQGWLKKSFKSPKSVEVRDPAMYVRLTLCACVCVQEGIFRNFIVVELCEWYRSIENPLFSLKSNPTRLYGRGQPSMLPLYLQSEVEVSTRGTVINLFDFFVFSPPAVGFPSSVVNLTDDEIRQLRQLWRSAIPALDRLLIRYDNDVDEGFEGTVEDWMRAVQSISNNTQLSVSDIQLLSMPFIAFKYKRVYLNNLMFRSKSLDTNRASANSCFKVAGGTQYGRVDYFLSHGAHLSDNAPSDMFAVVELYSLKRMDDETGFPVISCASPRKSIMRVASFERAYVLLLQVHASSDFMTIQLHK
jgi:hypothetical protein